MPNPARTLPPRHADAGFSLIELLAVCALIGIVAGIAVPQTSSMMSGYRLKGSAEGLHNTIGLARMRAAASLSRARVRVDLNARTFQMQTWDKTAAQWVTEGPVAALADGVQFGFGDIASPPPSTQAVLAQSPACTDDDGNDIADTACVTFNSRGMPVGNAQPPLGGGIVGNGGLYVTDGTAVYGITISAAPLVRYWWSKTGNNNAWVRQ